MTSRMRSVRTCPCGSSTTSATAWLSSRRERATSTTWRPRRRKGPRTASPRRTASASPAILQAGTDTNPYYTNSSQIPVAATEDPFRALELQEALQSKYTGGTVLHLYMGERMSSAQACRELVRRSLTRFRLPYITITPTFSICPNHGYLVGEHFTCEECAAADPSAEPVVCEVWTRVMGYFRPVQSFNIGKKGEYAERTFFTEDAAQLTPSSSRVPAMAASTVPGI